MQRVERVPRKTEVEQVRARLSEELRRGGNERSVKSRAKSAPETSPPKYHPQKMRE